MPRGGKHQLLHQRANTIVLRQVANKGGERAAGKSGWPPEERQHPVSGFRKPEGADAPQLVSESKHNGSKGTHFESLYSDFPFKIWVGTGFGRQEDGDTRPRLLKYDRVGLVFAWDYGLHTMLVLRVKDRMDRDQVIAKC